MIQENQHLQPGAVLAGGRYRILRFIGAGGFGCTYEAEYPDMGIRVAIKEFFVGDFCDRDAAGAVSIVSKSKALLIGKLREKFVNEARKLARLRHSGIVRVSDRFDENGTSYYVMDYISGRSLQSIIDQEGPLPEARALRYIGQVMDALEYVHGKSMLHLDIKPDNIMVDAETDRAILIDFGVSKQYDEADGHNTSTIMGQTPGYAPPEQAGNSIRQFTPAADIYALGATLYAALTGMAPPSSTDIMCRVARLRPLPAATSASTQAAIGRMMQPIVDNRPQSVAAARALLGMENGKLKMENDVSVPPVPPVTSDTSATSVIGGPSETKLVSPSKPKSKKWLWAVIVAAAIAIAIGAILLTRGSSPQPEEKIALIDSTEIAALAEVAEEIQPAEEPDHEPEPAEEPKPAEEPQPQPDPQPPTYQTGGSNRVFYANGIPFTMVYVQGGSFEMGATAEQKNGYEPYSDESPVHLVTLSDYYIGQTEVTQELWQAVMGASPTSSKSWTSGYGLGAKYPAYYISYTDCQQFISNLNSLTGQQFRMPTEAEWEYAARGGSKSRGNIFSGSNALSSVGWYYDNSGSKTHEVATKSPNELGIYDMSGNVWEWCSDWYGSYSSGSQTNPAGPSTGSGRVDRGGSWSNGATGCRVSNRGSSSPGDSYGSLGLRLAL